MQNTTDLDDDVAQAVDAAIARIRALGGSRRAVEEAGNLVALLSDAAQTVAHVRADAAAQMRTERGLSLAQLASALDISRARAQQLVQVAAKGR